MKHFLNLRFGSRFAFAFLFVLLAIFELTEGAQCGMETIPSSEEASTTLTTSGCYQDQFTCDDGECISQYYKCDNWADCADNSDETNCTTGPTTTTPTTTDSPLPCDEDQFQCVDDGMCVSLGWVCDGGSDCGDGSDEANCTPSTSTSTTNPPCEEPTPFQCGDGSCIPLTWICDGGFDCANQNDEMGCTPSTIVSPTTTTTATTTSTAQSTTLESTTFTTESPTTPSSTPTTTTTYPITTTTDAPCKYFEIECTSGSIKCIHSLYKCNGIDDCEDASDEVSCGRYGGHSVSGPAVSVDEGLQNKVSAQAAISYDWDCNARKMMSCKNGICFESKSRCDGIRDCSNGSDEEKCPPRALRLMRNSKSKLEGKHAGY